MNTTEIKHVTKPYVCLTCRTTFDVDASEVHYCACETCRCSRYTGKQCTQLCHEQEEDGMDSFVPDWPKTTMCANCEDGFSVRADDFETALEAQTEMRLEEAQ